MNAQLKEMTPDDELEWCPGCGSRGVRGEMPAAGATVERVDRLCRECNGHGVVLAVVKSGG